MSWSLGDMWAIVKANSEWLNVVISGLLEHVCKNLELCGSITEFMMIVALLVVYTFCGGIKKQLTFCSVTFLLGGVLLGFGWLQVSEFLTVLGGFLIVAAHTTRKMYDSYRNAKRIRRKWKEGGLRTWGIAKRTLVSTVRLHVTSLFQLVHRIFSRVIVRGANALKRLALPTANRQEDSRQDDPVNP